MDAPDKRSRWYYQDHHVSEGREQAMTNSPGPRRQPQLTDAELAREITRIKETLAIMPADDGRAPGLTQTLRSLETEQDSRITARIQASGAVRDSAGWHFPIRESQSLNW
jgi:hypothetical protein